MSCSGIWGAWHYQELLTTAIHSLIETKGEILKRIESKLKKKFGAKYG